MAVWPDSLLDPGKNALLDPSRSRTTLNSGRRLPRFCARQRHRSVPHIRVWLSTTSVQSPEVPARLHGAPHLLRPPRRDAVVVAAHAQPAVVAAQRHGGARSLEVPARGQSGSRQAAGRWRGGSARLAPRPRLQDQPQASPSPEAVEDAVVALQRLPLRLQPAQGASTQA